MDFFNKNNPTDDKMNRIYKTYYKERVFTLKEAAGITKNYQVAKNEIQRLIKKELVKRVLPGIYHIVPFDYQGYIPEPILIAPKLMPKMFFSHISALQIHDLVDSSEIFISCSTTKTIKIYSTTYNLLKTKGYFGVEEKIIGNQKVKVSDIERTFLDCLNKIDLFESLEAFEAVMSNAKINTNNLLEHLKKYGKKKLYNYSGYFLEKMKSYLNIEEKDLEKIKKRLTKKVYYLQIKPKSRYSKIRERLSGTKPKFIKQWNLVVVE